MKKRKIILLLLLSIALLFIVYSVQKNKCESPQNIQDDFVSVNEITKKKDCINISVNPHMEILSIVQYLGENTSGMLNRITQYSFEYRDEIDEYFNKYRNHEAVKFMDELIEIGFSYDAPPALMTCLDDEFNLKEGLEYPEYLVDRACGEENLNKLVRLLKEFYIDTSFHEFFSSNTGYYNEIIDNTFELTIDGEYISGLEKYFGESQNSYNMILTSLFHYGYYGYQVIDSKGNKDDYIMKGPVGVKGNIAIFEDESIDCESKGYFVHSFLNEPREKYKAKIYEYESLFNPIKVYMSKMLHGNWEATVNQHIYKGVMIRMAYREDEKLGEELLNSAKASSFIYIDEILNKLEEYENNRGVYETFEEFYPELLKAFEIYEEDREEVILQESGKGESINSVVMNKDINIFVVPTNEKSENRLIRAYVEHTAEFIEKKNNKKVEVITDEEAIERDLSDVCLLVYGTVEGNKLLKKYEDELPFIMEDKSITVDGEVYEGTILQFITVMDNPEDEKSQWVIYTANSDRYIYGINVNFHGPSAYHLYVDHKEVTRGFY